jgi:hypothetical protein
MRFNIIYSAFTIPACLLTLSQTQVCVLRPRSKPTGNSAFELKYEENAPYTAQHNKKTLCRAQPILSALSVFPKLNARNPVYRQEAKVGAHGANMGNKQGKGGHEEAKEGTKEAEEGTN